ncbi:DinB superfamily protein [Halobacillus dabanensis]|uniref:DinB superfamily protein n=1 Tax=Halobacillus dabanensis TaxID=240302 RepID=A0A1I3YSI3_HALDA|nr:DinB family protein [Halobacillus dabanensis]SFK34166.1 DinB superfamily protein [Halobacillus dabanensis]
MNFKRNEALEILGRTPTTLENFLSGLSLGWMECNEGEGTWNPTQVVDHLIECERNNWVPRLKTMVEEGGNKVFPPFDRDAHITNPSKTSLSQKLNEFKCLRFQNTEIVRGLIISDTQLELTGKHPAFGEVKLSELLSTWVVHDLTHISQIVRVMAERYREDVGPWEAYLGVLKN